MSFDRRLLRETLAAHFAAERLLSGMSAHVDLDTFLIREPAMRRSVLNEKFSKRASLEKGTEELRL